MTEVPMIVQACVNGARPAAYHPALPLTVEAMAHDAAACVAAGAAELHIHPRGPDGRESLALVDVTIATVRRGCPGRLIGVSSGAWIEADAMRTRAAIAAWREPPDYASVNLSEPDAPAVMAALHRRGVGIEAGVATVGDAERLAGLPRGIPLLRILIEIEEQAFERARALADAIAAVLDRAALRQPILLHGFDATVWPFVSLARERRYSTRVGLEDGRSLPDGSVARNNAALVSTAAALYRAPPAD